MWFRNELSSLAEVSLYSHSKDTNSSSHHLECEVRAEEQGSDATVCNCRTQSRPYAPYHTECETKVLTAVTMNINILWGVALCRLVNLHPCFGEAQDLELQEDFSTLKIGVLGSSERTITVSPYGSHNPEASRFYKYTDSSKWISGCSRSVNLALCCT